MVTLRRLVAILLLAVFGLPVLFPAVAAGQGTDAGLPACCRRTGKHHCAMSMGEQALAATSDRTNPVWKAPVQRCPYCPASVVLSHLESGNVPPPMQTPHAAPESHPHSVAQTECLWRMARDRSRQKRGPPVSRLS